LEPIEKSERFTEAGFLFSVAHECSNMSSGRIKYFISFCIK